MEIKQRQILRFRFIFASIVIALFVLHLIMMTGEAVTLEFIHIQDVISQLFIIPLIALFLFIYSIVLCRLALYLHHYGQNAHLGKIFIWSGVFLTYLILFFCFHHKMPLYYLALGKIFSLSLFLRFWDIQLMDAPFFTRMKTTTRLFLQHWSLFWVSRWIILGCWFLIQLALSIALLAFNPKNDMNTWEGSLLLATFFLIFRKLIKSPYSYIPAYESFEQFGKGPLKTGSNLKKETHE
jgi:hypothetical protein